MTLFEISPSEKEVILKSVQDLLSAMGFEAGLEAEDTVTRGLVVNISVGSESYLLIGKLGANLHALETLALAMVVRRLGGKFIRFGLDVDDYKRKREWYLKETVKQALDKAKTSGRAIALTPMPSYERRLVHSFVQEIDPSAVSTSTGEDPRRRVIVKYT